MINWIFFVCFISWGFAFELEIDDRSICFGRNATSIPVIEYCNQVGGELRYRCCRATDNVTFVAIDLMDANLTTITNITFHENLILNVIDLRDNPDLTLSYDGDEFLTMTYLNELLVPEHLRCPGGSKVWKSITSTTDPNGTYCKDQIDICANSTGLCVLNGAACSSNGPNHFLCSCKTGYHGYKCLRYGAFPTWIFLGTTIGATVLISAVLYFTQRRHVIK